MARLFYRPTPSRQLLCAISLLKPWVFREPRPTKLVRDYQSPITSQVFASDSLTTLFIITLPHRIFRAGRRINPPDYENTCSAHLGEPTRFAYKKRKACSHRTRAFFAYSRRHSGAVFAYPCHGRRQSRLLLDFAWFTNRPGLDLFPPRSGAMGKRHR